MPTPTPAPETIAPDQLVRILDKLSTWAVNADQRLKDLSERDDMNAAIIADQSVKIKTLEQFGFFTLGFECVVFLVVFLSAVIRMFRRLAASNRNIYPFDPAKYPYRPEQRKFENLKL